MTLIGSERKNQQFGFERRYLSDAVGMGESKTSGAVHSFIYIGNSTEGFGQPHTGGLRIDMPANMAVANMYDTHRIFGQSRTYLTESFEHRCQQGNTVDNFISPGFTESGRKGSLHRDGIIRPNHFPQRFDAFLHLVQWRTNGDTVLRHHPRKRTRSKQNARQNKHKEGQQAILSHKHASCRIVLCHTSMSHREVPPNVYRHGS